MIKNKKESQNPCFTDYYLLIVQDLSQAHYQILLIILLKEYKYGHQDNKCGTCRIKYKDFECCLEYTNVKDDLIEYKCLYCNKNYQKKSDENSNLNFFNTNRFSNHDANRFFLLLQKSVYPYKCMDY